MSSLAKQLISLKQSIEEESVKKGKLEARYNVLLEQLQSEWECDGVEGAEQILIEIDHEIKQDEGELNDILEELEDLGWAV